MAVYTIRWSPVAGDDQERIARNNMRAASAAFGLAWEALPIKDWGDVLGEARKGLLDAIKGWVLMPPPKPHLTLEWYHAVPFVGVFTIRADHGNGKPGALRYKAHERHRSWRKK